MLIVISPAKKLDETESTNYPACTPILFTEKVQKLVKTMQSQKPARIQALMSLSKNLAELNHKRYQEYHDAKVRKPAMYLFAGDTYSGLQAQNFNKTTVQMAQQRLRILSGLYGVLRPLDEVRPYRLEMGTVLKVGDCKNLYAWWKEDVMNYVNQELERHNFLVNLASKEYFKVLDEKKLCRPVLHFNFLDWKNGEYKMISFNAKKARGAMARFILEKNAKSPKELEKISFDGYAFCPERSSEFELTYTRRE